MRGDRGKLLPTLAASTLAVAMAAGPAVAHQFNSQQEDGSTADITLEDCLLESTKDISYVAFVDDGTQVDKDESIDAETFDLTTVDGIDEIDDVEVKSGTTVEDFAIDCTTAEQGDDTETPDDGETEAPDEGDDTDDGFQSQGNSEADITLSGCILDSTKDISYVAFVDDGTQVDKDESIDAETFDLTTVDGIDEIDDVEVKSGTTVEDFAIDCTTATADDGETEAPDDGESQDDGGTADEADEAKEDEDVDAASEDDDADDTTGDDETTGDEDVTREETADEPTDGDAEDDTDGDVDDDDTADDTADDTTDAEDAEEADGTQAA